MPISSKPFGCLPSGEAVTLYTLENAQGASVSVMDFGGAVVALNVPGKNGVLGDVVLGYDDVTGYFPNVGYLGALIGRVGNRIGHGRCVLDGMPLQLNRNANGHHLHGGNIGFDRKIWQAEPDEQRNALILTYVSADGEEHYPGTLRVKVTYAFSDDNALSIRYEADTDKNTLCNLTNHTYFNLSGEGSGAITNHLIQINADRVTECDKDLIPTGVLRDVTGTVFDLRRPTLIADGLRGLETDEQMRFGNGYDHNFALNGDGMRQVARLIASDTGRVMTVYTDLPGVQFYAGNSLHGVNAAKCGRKYDARDGLCLETQFFPDAANHENFASCRLCPDAHYDHETVYAFSVLP